MYNEGKKAFTAGAALAPYRMVKLDAAGAVVYAGATDSYAVGSTMIPAEAGDHVSVRLNNYAGTAELQAVGAIALDSDVVLAADGKIQQLPTGEGAYLKVGRAIQAATAADAVIEVLTCPPVAVTV